MYSCSHDSVKDIAQAQKWLRNCGSSIQVTGLFTIGMTTALCKFQRDRKMQVTGVLDDNTWKCLNKENTWFRRIFK